MKSFSSILFLLIFIASGLSSSDTLIHSSMSFDEAVKGTKAPKDLLSAQRLIDVEYYNFDGRLCKGQLVMHKELVSDVEAVFKIIKDIKYPVHKCVPIVKYNWDDNASMSDNNTSAFNYRFVAGTNRLSNHAEGRAIDINPFQNPAIYKSGKISPDGAKYDLKARGTLTPNHQIVLEFKRRGWDWGGEWTSLKDYQHFDKEK